MLRTESPVTPALPDTTTGALPVQPDLADRGDIDRLLVAFYSKALVDPLLGPVFATAGLDLGTHLPVIGNFWQRSLLHTGSYGGQPMAVHRHLHELVPLTAPMFDQWLALWAETVDESFSGPVATSAKETAQRVATAMQAQLSGSKGLPLVAPS